MEFVRKNMFYLVVGLVAALSLGGAVWASIAGSAVDEKLQQLENLRRQVTTEANGAANVTMIEEKRQRAEVAKQAFSRTLEEALSKQKINAFTGEPRKPLIDGILPRPQTATDRFTIRDVFEREHAKLFQRMRARDRATPEEIERQAMLLRGRNQGDDEVFDPWFPNASRKVEDEQTPSTPAAGKQLTLKEGLAQDATARAAEIVARQIYMYASESTIPKHPMVKSESPTDDEIWQAHMQLWIAQDFAVALSRLNEARAEELKKEGRPFDCWVAHMPVKRWETLRIQEWLGRGGGMNRSNVYGFADSFTRVSNDGTKFVVPIQLELIMEESAVMDVLDSICRVNFYTPTRIQYDSIRPDTPNPLQQDYIYGDAPIVKVRIDLEGYFFRKVYEEWINDQLKPILSKPGAFEDTREMGRG